MTSDVRCNTHVYIYGMDFVIDFFLREKCSKSKRFVGIGERGADGGVLLVWVIIETRRKSMSLTFYRYMRWRILV